MARPWRIQYEGAIYHIMSRDVGMYILKMYTGLKNKAIGEIFGVSLSAVNKAALRVSIQRRKQKGLGERIEKIAYSAFKV